MSAREQFAGLRAGVVIGMGGGFCFAYVLLLVCHALGWMDRGSAMHPVIWLFVAVPLCWFGWGMRLLKKVDAAA